MRISGLIVSAVAISIGAIALAHDGVQNSVVAARMDGMAVIQQHTKVLGGMARGTLAFDQASARASATQIAHQAGLIANLFHAQEDDPKSEAKDAIWQEFDDFSAKAEALRDASLAASMSLTDRGSADIALRSIGTACKACHQAYRK